MSDVGLGATLQLDIAAALRLVDELERRLTTVTERIPVTLEAPDASPVTDAIDKAVSAANTEVEATADADPVTAAIDSAVVAANTTVTPDAEADGVTAAIDEAVIAADTTVEPDAEAGGVTEAIDQAVAAADTTVEPDADATGVTAEIDRAVAASDTSVTPDADASGVTTAIDQAVDAADTTVPVDADTAAAETSIAALSNTAPVVVTADADTDPAQAALNALAAEDRTIEFTVEAETSGAEAAIDAVGNAATEAGGPVDDLGESVLNLSGAEGEAKESGDALGLALSGLGSVVTSTSQGGGVLANVFESVGGTAGIAAAGLGALTAATGEFFQAGLEAQVSQDRYNSTLGEFAEQVQNVNVGSLTGDLDDLAARLGTSDEALQDAATGIFRLGEASGAAGPEVARTTENILGLSLNVRALKPELGDAGVVAEGLTNALARGGRALVPYGLQITAAEIQTRALANTGKTAAEDLTVFERASAGAAIAVERYGASFDKAFAEGERSPATRVARLKNAFGELKEELGAELVDPVLGALEALQPLLLSAVTAIGSMVQALEPLFHLLEALGPLFAAYNKYVEAMAKVTTVVLKPLDLLASGLERINDLLPGASREHSRFKGEVDEAAGALSDERGELDLSAGSLGRYIETLSRFKTKDQIDDLARLGLSAEEVGELALKGAAGLEELRQRAEAAGEGGNVDNLVESLEEVERVLQANAQQTLFFGALNGDLDKSFVQLGQSTGDWVGALNEARDAANLEAEAVLNASLVAGGLTAAQLNNATAANTAADGQVNYVAVLAQVRAENLATSEAQERLNADLDLMAVRLPGLASSIHAVGDENAWLGLNLINVARTAQDANVTQKDLEVTARALGISTEQLGQVIEVVNSTLAAFRDEIVSTLPTIGDAFTDAAAKAEEAEEDLSAGGILRALQEQNAAIAEETENLKLLVASNFADLAGLAAQQGPEFVKAFADAVRAGDTETLTAFQHTLLTANVAYRDLIGTIDGIAPEVIAHNGQLAQGMSQIFGENLTMIDPVTGQLLGIGDVLRGNAGPLGAAGAGVGAAITGGVRTGGSPDAGVDSLPVWVRRGMANARAAIDEAVPGLKTSAEGAGGSTGGAWHERFHYTVKAGTDAGIATATGVIRAAGFATGSPYRAAADSGNAVAKSFTLGFVAWFAPGVGGATGVIVNAARTGAAASAQAAGTAQNAGTGVGQAFGQGMVNGINSYIGTIRAAAVRAVQNAQDAAKKKAGITSPSKEWAKIGRDMMLGAAQGIDQNSSIASDSAAKAAAQMVEAARTEVARITRSLSAGRVGRGGSVAELQAEAQRLDDWLIANRVVTGTGVRAADQSPSGIATFAANQRMANEIKWELYVRSLYGETATLQERIKAMREFNARLVTDLQRYDDVWSDFTKARVQERIEAGEVEVRRLEELAVAQRNLQDAEARLAAAQQQALERNRQATIAWSEAAAQAVARANVARTSQPIAPAGGGTSAVLSGSVSIEAAQEAIRLAEWEMHHIHERAQMLRARQASLTGWHTALNEFGSFAEQMAAFEDARAAGRHTWDGGAEDWGFQTADGRWIRGASESMFAEVAGLREEIAQLEQMYGEQQQRLAQAQDDLRRAHEEAAQQIRDYGDTFDPGSGSFDPGGATFDPGPVTVPEFPSTGGGGAGAGGGGVQVTQDIDIAMEIKVEGPMSERAARTLGRTVGDSAAQRIRDLQHLATSERLQNGG